MPYQGSSYRSERPLDLWRRGTEAISVFTHQSGQSSNCQFTPVEVKCVRRVTGIKGFRTAWGRLIIMLPPRQTSSRFLANLRTSMGESAPL